MKTKDLLKGVCLAGLGILCSLQINAQSAVNNRSEGVNSVQGKAVTADINNVIASLQSLSNQGREDLYGVITSLQNLSNSVDSKTGVVHFQNLSNNRNESVEGTYRNESVEGTYRNESVEGTYRNESVEGAAGRTELQNLSTNSKLQKLSSKEVVAELSGVISSLEGRHDSSLDNIISNLKSVTEEYKGSSYSNLRESITE